ncbi:mucin-2 [Mustela putorius furo]|uniref:Mucin-2 n=1 Tax=Mustela putorius furo TaxID=9669 RepID=A0A8U0RGD4_MUSPF|nr:mucin-2 [Mustela putorius furo]
MGLPLALLVAVGLALSSPGAAELQREGRTQNHSHSVCSTWGDFHYKTFDGDVFRFPGLCDYNFASDCRGPYKEFAVHLKRVSGREGGRPGLEYILLTIKDDTIYLTRQLVVVNGAMVSMPHYSSGLLIEKNDAYTKVYSRAGLTLMWNREDSLMLELDSKFRNHTCGLCGDYNGLQTYSEFLSDGVLFSAIEFGNLQKVHKPEAVCEDPEEEPAPESCSQHRAECEELLVAAAFEDCEGRVPRQPFVQACVQDRCHCPDGPSCACSTLAEFSRQCSHAGGRPGNWRTAEFCPKSCPGNMVYLESGSPCVDTCSHLESSRLCEEHRMDGCFCPEGTVYDDIAGSGCVPVSRCHCRLHGRLYSPGQQLSSDCEECVCTAGRWVCRDLPCPGTCALEGGSHITTFDGKRYTFHGDCYYVLIKGDHNDSYALLGELAPCGSTDKQTCLKTVVLLADDRKNVVAFQSDGSVLLNERPVSLPHATASLSVFRPSSRHLMVSTAVGLRLQVQLEPVMQLFVTLDRAAQGRVQGLCGNFNGLEGDDFRTAGGLVEATGAGFANTWKAQASCHDKLDWLDDPCSLNIESANYAEHWCSLLKKTETPFGRCHSAVDPSDYYKRCKYDACNCQNSEGCMCAALSSYARACAAKGVLLWGWREQVCNEDVGSCPNSQVFLYNLTTCQPTCRSLSEADAHCPQGFAPVDGCGCPDNTFLDEKGRCVPLAKCSCYHHGLYLEAGEVVLRQEERCVCQNGRLHCRPVRLLGQSCSAPKIYVDCSNLTALTVQSSRPTSCQTRAAGHYQTECVSGCVCPDGLMDDGRGGCVEEAECPCAHNKDLYSPGDEITVDCNTCTCRRGRWACTESPCHGSCSIYGSGHYVTFDGKYYDFDGHCSYVAVQDYCGQNSSSGSFSVMTENVPCGTTGVTCSKAIKIFLGRTELKLEDKHRLVIQRDTGHHVAYTTREVGQYLVVEASIGVIVIWDKKTTVFIKLAPSYKGRVCGLCGNFDQRSSNDFTTRDHMVVDSELDFGNSWKEAPTCPDVSVTPDPCARNPHRLSWAEKQCSIIKSSVFSVCHSKVDPKPFYEACVHDSCSCDTGGDCECFCSAVASYAQECTKEGACVFWRTPDLCPVFCDYYNPPDECEWHYEPCGNRSFETCRTINGIHSNISVSYLEGCYPRCPEDRPIYDEDLKRCVTADQCGCYVGDTRYPPGASVPSEEDCQSCVCTNTSKVCQPEEGKILNYTQDGFFCYWEICGPNGTVERHFNICVSTTSRPPSTTVPVTSSTPLTTTTTSPTPTPSPTPSTGLASTPETPGTCCFWSDWINENHPSVHSGSGDWETFDSVCKAPEDIECRLAVEPHLSWEQAGQNAQCNVTFGFVCYNEDQFGNGPFEVCYDYEIRVNCCVPMDQCPPSTTTATTTTTTTSTPTPEPPTTTTTTTTATPTPTPTTTPTTTTTGTEPPTISTTGPKTTTPSPSTTTTTTVTPTSTPTISTTTGTKTTTPTPTTTTTTPTTTTTGTVSPTTSTTTPTQGLSTTEPTITPCVPQCNWTGWVDSGKPNPSRPGGDIESIQGLCKEGWAANISCRAVMFPHIPIEELGQKLVCDLSVGLVCKNEDQKPGGITPPICLNYEINVECCVLPDYCISTLPPASTPTPTRTTTTTTGTPTTTTPTTTTTGTPTPTMTTGTATTTPIITTTTGIPTSTPTISTTTGTGTTTPTPTTTTTTTVTPTSTPTISTTTGTETTTPTPATTTTTTVTPTSTPTISTTTGTGTTTPTPTTTTTTTVTPTSTPTISTTTGTGTTTPTPTTTTTTTVTATSTPTISTTTGTKTTTSTPATTTTTVTPTSTPTISTTTGTGTTTPTPATTTTTTVTPTSTPTISTTTGTGTTTRTPTTTTTTTVTPTSTPTISTTTGTGTTTPTPATTTTTTVTPTSTPTISTTTGTGTTTPTPTTTTTTTVTPTLTPTISTTTGTKTTTPTPTTTTTTTVTPTSTPTISTTTGTGTTTPTPTTTTTTTVTPTSTPTPPTTTTTTTVTPTSTPTISTTTGTGTTTPTPATTTTTTTVTPTSTPTISTTTGTGTTTPTPTTTTTTTVTPTSTPTISTTTGTKTTTPTPATTTTTTVTPTSTPTISTTTGTGTTTPTPTTTTTTTVTPTSTPTISTTTGTKTTTPTPTTTTTTPTTTTTGTVSPTTSTTTPTQGLSTTEPTITPCVPQCNWTGWVDSGKPNPSRPGGDIESIQGLCKEGWAANISCRAVMFPHIPIEELGQKLVCDLSVGLVCKNEDQKPGGITPPICLNYEINVECCVLPDYCISTLPPASTPTPTPTISTTTGTETTTPTPTTTTTTTTTVTPTSTPTISTTTGTETTTPTPATTTTTVTPTSTPIIISTTTGTGTTTPNPASTTTTVTPTLTPTISTTTGTETTTPTPTTTTTTTMTPTSTPTISTTTGTKTTTPTPATTTTTTVTPTSTPTISTTTGTGTTTPTPTTTTTTTVTPTSTPTISTTTGTETTTPTPATTTTTVTPTSTPTISTTTGTKTTTPTPATTTTTVTPTLTPTISTTTGTETTTPTPTTTTTTVTPTSTPTISITTGTGTTTPTTTTTTVTPTSTPTISTTTGTETTTATVTPTSTPTVSTTTGTETTTPTTTTTTVTQTSTPTVSTTTGTETTTPTTTTATVTPTSTPTVSTTTGTETTTPTTTTTTTVTQTSTPTVSTTTGTETTTPTTTTTTVTPTSTPTISTTTGTETTTPTTTTTTETPTSTSSISTTTGTETTTPTTTTTTVTPTSTPTISTTTGTETTTPTTTTTTVTPTSTSTISTTTGTETTTPTTTTTTVTPTSTPTISTTTGTETTTPTTTTTTVTPTSTSTISTTTGTETTTPTTTTTTVTPTSTSTISTTTGTETTTPTTTTTTVTPTSTSTISTSMGSTPAESTTLLTSTTAIVEISSTLSPSPPTEPKGTTTGGTSASPPPSPGSSPPGPQTSGPTSSKTTPTSETTTRPPSPTPGTPSTPTPTTASTTTTGTPRPPAPSRPPTASTTTSYAPTPTLTPISTPNVGVSTGPVRSSTQVRCCVLNETYYAPGEMVYNGTHGDTCYYANCSLACAIEIFSWSCPSAPSPAPTPSKPTPVSTHKPPTPTALSTVATTKPPGCPDFDPPRQENEKWWLCNCTMAICKYNNTVELVEVECEVPPEPTCANGLRPTLVYSPEECCPHWECDCYCAGWGDPHYVTFDGLYYSYQGNCTYVLVEEITPTLGNFGVYIDNYHCDANDRVSCPRTLVVRYQSQEVLIKTLQMMPIKVQVQVNRQVVALPYMKNELHVYQSGISYMVEISKLGALITYNGLSFSITLPHRLFGNNTKGQCGTCTNDTADDCMLPSGEVVSDCELAADQWVVNDPSKPHCPHTSVTTKRPAITPPGASTTSGKDCASPLCELIRDSLFAPCHAVVPPKHYYEACVFDSCFVPGSGLECASLQAYAALCAQANICVDWRNHTHGVCSMTCPPHREYRACGPADEPSCESSTAALRPMAQKNARLVEGCFCPEGTMNYAPGFDVCVEMCGCVGPDDVPRKFGEHFEFDCKDCVCLEGGRGIICEPKECRQEPVACLEDGTYPLTEVNPADTCCNITSCKCNTSLCQEKPPKCPLGFDVSSETKPGKCCPSYSCVPKGVCVHANAEYQPGSPVYSSKCEDCVCTNRTDSSSRLNIISCTHVHCEDSCSPGFELVDVPGQCCGKCQQTHCIIKRPGTETIILKPGDIRHDPTNNCTFFSCANIHNQLISSVSNITCPDFDPSICLPGSVTLMPNGCCRKCIPRNETRIFCSTVPMTKEISHSGCTKKVVMNSCSGSCGTSVKYSAEAQALDHQCSCCKEGRTSQREVELSCPDGSSRKHRYTHIESCSCQDTVCGLPRAQRRAPGLERRASPRGLPLGRD